MGTLRFEKKHAAKIFSQAVYLSIVDSCLTGPSPVSTEEAMSVLGVSENTVGKVRRLAIEVEEMQIQRQRQKMESRYYHIPL